MAERGGRSKAEPPPHAVEDSELFPFKLDDTPPLVVARPSAKRQPAPERPHYHDHRARLRLRFDEAGPGALADYELLEFMLFRTIPRQDTKPLAKALLAKFGS